jgi:hypothetical protein
LNAEFRGASGEPLQDGYLSSNCSQHPGLSQRQLQTGGSQLATYLGRLEREYAPCSYSRSGKFGRTKLTYFSVEGEKCAGAPIDNQRGRHSLGHHWRHSTIGDPANHVNTTSGDPKICKSLAKICLFLFG